MLEPNVPEERVDDAPSRKLPSIRHLLLTVCGLIALSGWGVAFWAWRHGPTTPLPKPAYLLKPILADGGRPATIVLEDPLLSKSWHMNGQEVTFESFVAGRYLNNEDYKAPEAVYLRTLLTDSYYVQLPALQLSQRLAVIAESNNVEAVSVPCRTLAPQAVENGNFIFIGGMGANPWVGEIQKHLAFEHQILPKDGNRPFVNRSPRPGEPAVFQSSHLQDPSPIYYTRIALLNNPFGSGKVALLGGASREATEAAGQFALSQTGLDEVHRACGVTADRLTGFELILETRALAGSPVKRTVVASRCQQ